MHLNVQVDTKQGQEVHLQEAQGAAADTHASQVARSDEETIVEASEAVKPQQHQNMMTHGLHRGGLRCKLPYSETCAVSAGSDACCMPCYIPAFATWSCASLSQFRTTTCLDLGGPDVCSF